MKAYTPDQWIDQADFEKLMRLVCPNCGEYKRFIFGPRGGMARNILCSFCKMEFNFGPVGAQVIAQVCAEDRQREVYHLVVAQIPAAPETEDAKRSGHTPV